MREIFYREVPTPDAQGVCQWLHQEYRPPNGQKIWTPTGIRVQFASSEELLVLFVWSVQRTTYLKGFSWSSQRHPHERALLHDLDRQLQHQFPLRPSPLPKLSQPERSIFEQLQPRYPRTVDFFRKFPNGEADLSRVYWWEQRWREAVRHPHAAETVIVRHPTPHPTGEQPTYDLIYVGGALGIIHAAVMARLGYRVLLVERLAFGRMNREWNISRQELEVLIQLQLFTAEEIEALIAREYQDGFHKFFDANVPNRAKAPVLTTPTVLNVALDSERLLRLSGEKFRAAGGEIWDQTEFIRADIYTQGVTVESLHLPNQTPRLAHGRLLVDAMGTASPIAWQLTGGRPFDSVCPTVGAVIGGLDPVVWNPEYGDVLNSHGDISRGRQLIWELFPAQNQEVTIYLFHYHQVHPDNPGSLLELYEDFFTILPEYRRCNLEKLTWRKATFGYIPGYFSVNPGDRAVAWDRLIAIGDAASLQSPLIFTGFGSLVRNLPRLTALLNLALRHDFLEGRSLNQIRAYQSNVAITWLFSKGMMVPHGQSLHPAKINAMLNTFFKVMTTESPAVVDAFMKDQTTWVAFNRMALKAAWLNPALLWWIWQLAGLQALWRWTGNYLNFSVQALKGLLLRGWFPRLLCTLQPWLEGRSPRLWFWLLVQGYGLMTETPLMLQSPLMPRLPIPPITDAEISSV